MSQKGRAMNLPMHCGSNQGTTRAGPVDRISRAALAPVLGKVAGTFHVPSAIVRLTAHGMCLLLSFQSECHWASALRLIYGTEPKSGPLSSMLIAVTSLLRGLPLFLAARPRTPLRVLCIMVFDTLHRLRTSQRLPIQRIRMLAGFRSLRECRFRWQKVLPAGISQDSAVS